MRKLIVLLILVAGAVLAGAQDVPKVELFGGYSYLNVGPTGATSRINTSGWEAALNYNFSKHWGLVGDFSGHYCCSGQSIHNFMVGPQLSLRKDKYTVFVHGLVGGSHAVGLSESDTNVAWAAGGGVDWNAWHSVGIRIAQVDYLGTHFLGNTQTNLRVSTGVVFRFGKR